MHHNLGIFSLRRCKHYFSQTEKFTSNVQFGYPCLRGRGGGHHKLGIFSCKRCELYFSQTEMFTSNVQFGYTCPRDVQAGLSCPRPGFRSGSVISQFLLHHNLGIFSCKRYKHHFSQTEMLHPTFSLVTLVRGVGGGQTVQAGLSCPPPRIWGRQCNQSIFIDHNLGIFSCKRYKHYFSQTETFTSNVPFGYPCPRGGGGGKLSRLVYLAPCPGFGSGSVISQFLLTINLEYLVVRDVNFISAKLRCLHPTFSLVTLVRGMGGKLSRLVYLAPAKDLGQTVSSVNFYCTIILEY